ncbi:hypothetical protein PNEG_00879 [Pneumocystis murina B123]|uniref:Uncharacterized protein n=1 Tax=Pneumocystis murina (strain B123) TaxID=1069680 RepID=M7PJV2_PNEMU|nr:hypothetical protein PNEG_00879 [Pneumocystis murina B123]EMR10729.1 hypothetical protein PNEG_00879 [Pneumocystis murina B123]
MKEKAVNGIIEEDKKEPLMLMQGPSSGNHQSSLRLDNLGPLVVNRDGTLARIENWETLTEIEKNNIERVLVRRNRQRLEALRSMESEEVSEE